MRAKWAASNNYQLIRVRVTTNLERNNLIAIAQNTTSLNQAPQMTNYPREDACKSWKK